MIGARQPIPRQNVGQEVAEDAAAKEAGRLTKYFTTYNKERDKREARMLWNSAKWGAGKVKAGGAAVAGVAGAGAGYVAGKVTETGNAAIFIFLSMIMYFLDIRVRYNGIMIRDFSFFTLDFIMAFAYNGVVLVLLISYALIYRPNMRDYISTAFLILTGSFIYFLGGFSYQGGLFHIILILFLYIFLIRPSSPDKAAANYMTSILILFDYIGYGLLGYFFSATDQFSQAATLLTNRLVLPVWFYYTLVLTHDQKKSWLTSLAIFLVVTINVFYFASAFGAIQDRTDILTEADIKSGMEFWRIGIVGVKDFYNNLVSSVKQSIDSGLTYATGGYYDSVVEQNEKEPLGVYLDGIPEPNIEHYEGEAISQWWTLKARTLDKEKKINILLWCKADEETDTERDGTIFPDDFPSDASKNLEIYNLEERDVECSFEEFELIQGSRAISLYADFNFQTMSYLKRYFMDLETMRAMNREEIDILSYYKIVDREPITKYTSGPVKIGIGGTSPLIGITTVYDNKLRLGFSLDREWEGKISKINELTVYLPQGIEFDTDLCNNEFKSDGLQKLGEESVNVYKLTGEAKNSTRRVNQERMSFNCKIKIDPGYVNDVLGITPITIKYFRVEVEYNFQLKKTTVVSVQREGGFNVRIDPVRPTSDRNLNCIGTHSSEDFEKVSYWFYKGDDPIAGAEGRAERKSDRVYYSLQLPHDDTVMGDRISCRMEVKLSGIDEIKKAKSAPVTILDTPPKFNTLQMPDSTCSGIAYDEDGHTISANYVFAKGDKILKQGQTSCSSISGNNKEYECKETLDSSKYSLGDSITCSMTPFSYGTNGDTKTTQWVVP